MTCWNKLIMSLIRAARISATTVLTWWSWYIQPSAPDELRYIFFKFGYQMKPKLKAVSKSHEMFLHRVPESCVDTPADHDYHHPATPDEYTQLMKAQAEIARLQAEYGTLMERSGLLSKETNDNSAVRFYTGFLSYSLSQVIYPITLTMKYIQHQLLNTAKHNLYSPRPASTPVQSPSLVSSCSL